MSEALFGRIQHANVAYLYDPRENSRWGMLRCLPALHYLGIDHFTYPASWRQLDGGGWYDFLDYEFEVISEIDRDSPPAFGVITNRHYEEETPYSINQLVKRYTVTDSTLVVVADSRDFTPEGGNRPLAQEQFVDRIGNYSQLYEAFERYYAENGISLPLSDTKNLFAQDNAKLHEIVTGDCLQTVEDLFDVLPSAPYLPLYDAFTEIFGRSDDFGAVPLESDEAITALGRWLRRRIEWDRGMARDVARQLNMAVVDDAQTFDRSYARRSTTVADAARRARREIDPDVSGIDSRYRAWLTRFDTG